MRSIVFIFVSLLAFNNLVLSASVVNTKHNLSVSNSIVPDANETIIKAQTETEICVFCHIPHNTRPAGKPLWNRSMPASSYTMYDSDYLRRINYPAVESDLGVANDTPGALSRQCLSCHDGTVAVGAVYKLRQDWVDGTPIDMDGVDASGMIPAESSTSFGTDLTNHHPVGIVYDSSPTVTFGDGGVKGTELNTATAVETAGKVRLFEYDNQKYVECSSCHNPHKDNGKFLHVNDGNHATNVANTCTSCHQKDGWDTSVHNSPPGSPSYTDPTIIEKYGTSSVAQMKCANCHTPHNAEGVPYLNRKQLGLTCFQGAASTVDGAACHGVGGAKDIQSNLTPIKTYGHPVVATSTGDSNHTNLDSLYGTGSTDLQGKGGMSWDNNKHAVCMDCHNPHQAQPGTHAPDGQWYPDSGTSTNLVSGPLKGVPGVEPDWPTEWTQPTTFTTMKESTKEYQICFKCHSYYGMGHAVDGVNTGGHYSPSDPTQLLTDVAWEMNKENKSGHPVVFPNNATGRPGSYAPQELADVQLIAPWTGHEGTITMYCSDCHGSDTEDQLGNAKGPHGSNLAYLLKGDNHSWPRRGPLGVDAGGVEGDLYVLDDIYNETTTDLFCKNCHDISHPHDKWRTQMENQAGPAQCVECHVAVPHGSPVSRLIGYTTFPEPYNYGGNSLRMIGWKKSEYDPLDAGTRKNALTPAITSCVNGMDDTACHTTDSGGYDANLMP